MNDFKVVMPTTQEEWQRDCQIAYEQGRANYEAECQKIFEDNPPMHFNHEQIMWLKEFVKIRCNQARADVVEEIKQNIIPTMYEFDVTQETIDFCINILEQFKEQKK